MTRIRTLQHPARLVAEAFGIAVVIGTALLALPIASNGDRIPLVDAFFTATSAVCVTGLAVVDTGTAWSPFGIVVLLVLVQVGGLGIMTLASIVAIALSRRLGMHARRLTQAEAGSIPPGELKRVLKGVAWFSLVVELSVALALTVRFRVAYGMDGLQAAGQGIFHSITAFNNAGFALRSDNLMPYVTDVWINVPVMTAIVIGGLGFPVLVELTRRRFMDRSERAHRRLSLHTNLTLLMTAVLLLAGFFAVLVFEWGNTNTIGGLDTPDKLLASMFQSVTTRTAGFNTIDTAGIRETTGLFTNLLMFVGSGSASTGGGIKVTTVAVLTLICVAEIRGERDVVWARRRILTSVQRQAVAVTLISIAVVGGVTTLLLMRQPFQLEEALFEATSAFGTVGLSRGITPQLDTVSRVVIAGLMFFGRVGPATLGAAFVLRTRDRLFEYPEETPLVG
jgi:trk system potassium uptake protein